MIERLFLVMHTCKVKTIFSLQLPLKSGAAVPQSLACLPTSKVSHIQIIEVGISLKKGAPGSPNDALQTANYDNYSPLW